MNTTSNIAAMQISGGANTPQSQSPGQSPDGLLGFMNALIQQLQAARQGGGTSSAAQNSPQGIKGLTAEIAALLKKDGVSADALQTMSPQDLAAKITALLQQQNIAVPPSLQNLSPQDLATQIASAMQQNGGPSGNSPTVKPALTSDLIAPQSASVQGSNVQEGQTKDDIAKKISAFLEKQQQQGSTATPLNPAQLSQLKDSIAQLQSAPGTISPDTLNKLTTDVGSFLASQGVGQTAITGFLADLTQSLQKNQITSQDASSAATTIPAIPTTTVVSANQPVVQQAQTNTPPLGAPTQGNAPASSPSPQITGASPNLPVKNFWQQDNKTPILGGNSAAAAGTSPQLSALIAQQQPQTPLSQQDLTAKIAGFSVNPALINDLANNNNNSGSGSGFGSQGDNAQQSQDPAGTAALLQPVSADMLQNQNFTNYMTASHDGQPSPTTQLVNVQLQSNISAGVNTMTLQLDPADLGKMNVKLSFAKDGTVKAHMTVDKPETLALLQKDSSHLQRALQQSGLTTDENSLSFDLRQQSQQHNMNGFNGNGGNDADEFDSHMDGSVSNALQAQLAIQSSGYITPSGVNIMV